MPSLEDTTKAIKQAQKTALIVECTNHDLLTSGSKEELQERLIEFFTDHPEKDFQQNPLRLQIPPRSNSPEPLITQLSGAANANVTMDQLAHLFKTVLQDRATTSSSHSHGSVADLVKFCYRNNIKFKGDCNGSVNVFLEQICEAQHRFNVSDLEMFSIIPEFLIKDAEIWYRASKNDYNCFFDLCRALKTDFLPHDYEVKLLREIRARFQAGSESMTSYVSKLRATNSRLSQPLPDTEIVALICTNAHPDYLSELCRIKPKTFAEILSVGREVEQLKLLKSEYQAPQQYCKVDPTLDIGPSAKSKSDIAGLNKQEKSFRPVKSFRPNFVKNFEDKIQCWNCGDNHRFNLCQKPRVSIFCFLCGQKDVTVKNCPKCHPSDDARESSGSCNTINLHRRQGNFN